MVAPCLRTVVRFLIVIPAVYASRKFAIYLALIEGVSRADDNRRAIILTCSTISLCPQENVA